MSKRTIFWCDFCSEQVLSEKLKKLDDSWDICEGCAHKILTRTAQCHGRAVMNLRPFCKECHGIGKVTERVDDGYDHVIKAQVECAACKL